MEAIRISRRRMLQLLAAAAEPDWSRLPAKPAPAQDVMLLSLPRRRRSQPRPGGGPEAGLGKTVHYWVATRAGVSARIAEPLPPPFRKPPWSGGY